MALYLYCIRKKSGKKLRASGIDRKKVFNLSHKDIEAVVSEIDAAIFGSQEIARRAREDVGWIVEHARHHEHVLEVAMGLKIKTSTPNANRSVLSVVIPMKFGTIFKSEEKLHEMLARQYASLTKTLKHLDGKEEWGVKVYVREKAFKEELKKTDTTIKKRYQEAGQLPRGEDYFKELEVEKTLKDILQKNVKKKAKMLSTTLGKPAVTLKENKILRKDFTGHKDPMIINGAYLITHKNVGTFRNAIKKLQKDNPVFIFDVTGPWPPYNFV